MKLDNDKKINSIRSNFVTLAKLIRRAQLKSSLLIIPGVLAFLASLLEGLSLGLLMPLFKGIIEQDFSFMAKLPLIGDLTGWVPAIFNSSIINNTTFLIVVIFLATFAKVILNYFSALLSSYLMRLFNHRLRSLIFERFLSFGKLFFDRNNYGRLQQVIADYTRNTTGLLFMLQRSIYGIVTLAIYLVILISISWQLTLIVVAIFPTLHYTLKSLIEKIKQTSEDFIKSVNALSANILNSLSTIPLVKVYAFESSEKSRFDHMNKKVELFQFSIDKKTLLIAPVQELISLFFILLIILIMVFMLDLVDSSNLANYAVFLLILRRASALFGTFNGVRSALAGASGPLNEINCIFEDGDKFIIPDGKKTFTALRSGITLKNLTYAFPDGPPVLIDINLDIKKGDTTAIVGQSGAGKSTLINLILRFYDPPAKTIYIDDTDIQELEIKSWRKAVALVSQDTLLFNATLYDNIVYGLERKVSDTEINNVLSKVKLDSFVESLPKGILTEVGDRGIRLSGGEKQRVSIARAFLKDAEIILLDEATSSLDSLTEKAIQSALAELLVSKTTIVIAHRLATIKHADYVVVLEGGRVIEQGALSMLLDKKGAFYRYWEEQRFF